MQIFVDADACPVVEIVEIIAEKYNISTTLLLWHLEKGSQGPVDLGFEPTEAERRPHEVRGTSAWTDRSGDHKFNFRWFNHGLNAANSLQSP